MILIPNQFLKQLGLFEKLGDAIEVMISLKPDEVVTVTATFAVDGGKFEERRYELLELPNEPKDAQ